MSKQLFAATTKHQQEVRAAGELRALGFRVFLPKKHRQGIVLGHKVAVITTLRYTGYIFVEFDLALEQHGVVKNAAGINELLCWTDRSDPQQPKSVPMALHPDWEPEITRHIDEEFELASGKAKPDPRADLHHGDTVKINRRDHAMHNVTGEYSRTENGIATVFVGTVHIKIPEIDLVLIQPWEKTAA